MEFLNYHHLYYFWVIAKEGSITKACSKLRLAQSTLSAQLKYLEDSLDTQLFERKNRTLHLTDSGRLALSYADTIFNTGRELMDILKNRPVEKRQNLVRVGCIDSISKNLQYEFVVPCLTRADVKIMMVESSLTSLTKQLKNHLLDVVLTNMPVPTDKEEGLFNHALGEIEVCIVGDPKFARFKKSFPESLEDAPMYVPTHQSRVRSDFDGFLEQNKVCPKILGEIEDISLLRLFALSGYGMAVLPEIAVRSEIKDKKLVVIKTLPTVYETVWAVTATRKNPNPMVAAMIREFSGRHTLSGRKR